MINRMINTTNEISIYQDAVNQWGIKAQIEQAEEEISELFSAIKHFKRKKNSIKELTYELADVSIMIEQLKILKVGYIELNFIKALFKDGHASLSLEGKLNALETALADLLFALKHYPENITAELVQLEALLHAVIKDLECEQLFIKQKQLKLDQIKKKLYV